jgi:two-component system, OmpR family, KDP operon response regulator KdpE
LPDVRFKLLMRVRRILVIDDEPQMRRVLRASLIAHGYEVVEAESGEEGITRLNAEQVDCVLLDLNLPGLDGFQTCRAIRVESRVPVLVVSIRGSEKDRAAAREAGADGYITKPFGVKQLLPHIEALIAREP